MLKKCNLIDCTVLYTLNKEDILYNIGSTNIGGANSGTQADVNSWAGDHLHGTVLPTKHVWSIKSSLYGDFDQSCIQAMLSRL